MRWSLGNWTLITSFQTNDDFQELENNTSLPNSVICSCESLKAHELCLGDLYSIPLLFLVFFEPVVDLVNTSSSLSKVKSDLRTCFQLRLL